MTILKPQRQPQPTLEIITKRLEEEPKLPEIPTPEFKSHQPEPIPPESTETKEETLEEKPVETLPPDNENRHPEEQDENIPIATSIPRPTPEPAYPEPEVEEESLDTSLSNNESTHPVEQREDVLASIPQHTPELEYLEIEAKEDIPVVAPRLDNEDRRPTKRTEDVLASIPRRMPKPVITPPLPIHEPEEETPEPEEETPAGPSTSEVIARKSARALAKGMQATRAGNQKLKDGFDKLLPRLLPNDDSEKPVRLSSWVMSLIAVVIPLIVVTIASVVYFRFGSDQTFDNYVTQAQEARAQAKEKDDPLAQRLAWEDVLTALDLAEDRKVTDETRTLRTEAENNIDALLNIWRLDFKPAIIDLPRGLHITRIAANDSELFLLDESTGTVLRAYLVGDGYQHDDTFVCEAGNYGGKNIGNLVEIQILPKSNALGASILAFDAQGGLLYCAANEYPQATFLAEPSVGFRDITAVTLQSDVLYVLDAPSHEVWVYGGQASTFVNYPTAFFSTETPEGIDFAVDMSINDTDLYLLFNDGHLATCTYSLLESVPTRCVNPVQLIDSNPASGGGYNFGEALFTEIHISEPPDSAILLLSGESQSIFRFSPRYYELLNQLKASSNSEANLPDIALTALATNANHTLFIAQDDQVYMVMDTP